MILFNILVVFLAFRRTHHPKAAGVNPAPATRYLKPLISSRNQRLYRLHVFITHPDLPIMRDSKDHTTFELPGFELADLALANLSKKKSLANPAAAATAASKLSRKTRTIRQNQLELLAPLGQTDQSGLPAWKQDEGLDQSGLPIWGLAASGNKPNIINT